MKRTGNLWEVLVSSDNLMKAYLRAIKGKTHRESVLRLMKDPEFFLDNIQRSLVDGTYQVSPYKMKNLYRPKFRVIHILPTYPDNIIQHAVLNVVEPVWDNLLISDCYSCRRNKGQHKGIIRCMEFVRTYTYALKCDISKFYPNINHAILKEIIANKIKDEKVLDILYKIIDSANSYTRTPGKDVPIGNVLSPWFGNIYLNKMDMLIKHRFGIKGYLRYCDDFVLFSNSKEELKEIREYLRSWLKTELGLTFSMAEILPSKNGVDFLGYRQFPKYILVRKSTVKRLVRGLRWAVKKGSYEYLSAYVASMKGWLIKAQTWNLRNKCERILLERHFDDDQKIFGFLERKRKPRRR